MHRLRRVKGRRVIWIDNLEAAINARLYMLLFLFFFIFLCEAASFQALLSRLLFNTFEAPENRVCVCVVQFGVLSRELGMCLKWR